MKKLAICIFILFFTTSGYCEIPNNIKNLVHPKYWGEYQERAERAIKEQDPDILKCVEFLKPYNGYGGTGDYGSFEYCQWWKDKEKLNKESTDGK